LTDIGRQADLVFSRERVSSDRGSVLLLGIGFIGVCLLALAVITDSSSAFIQQRELQAQADSLALAGAQGIDLIQYYQNGATEATSLNANDVAHLVMNQFDAVNVDSRPTLNRPTLQLSSTNNGVFVTLTAPLRLTFFDSFATKPIKVTASARLDYRPY
jgi:uncharacterized membrane protein